MVDQHEPANTKIVAIGVMGSVAIFVVVALLVVFFQHVVARVMFEKVESVPSTTLRSLRAEEEIKLTKYAWLDQAAGVVRIPIEQAMALEVEAPWHPQTAPPPAEEPPGPSSPKEQDDAATPSQ